MHAALISISSLCGETGATFMGIGRFVLQSMSSHQGVRFYGTKSGYFTFRKRIKIIKHETFWRRVCFPCEAAPRNLRQAMAGLGLALDESRGQAGAGACPSAAKLLSKRRKGAEGEAPSAERDAAAGRVRASGGRACGPRFRDPRWRRSRATFTAFSPKTRKFREQSRVGRPSPARPSAWSVRPSRRAPRAVSEVRAAEKGRLELMWCGGSVFTLDFESKSILRGM